MQYFKKLQRHIKKDSNFELFKKFFSQFDTPTTAVGPQTLIEMEVNFSNLIAISYFTRVWNNQNLALIGIDLEFSKNLLLRLKKLVLSNFSISNGVLSPFEGLKILGVKRFIFPKNQKIKRILDTESVRYLNQLTNDNVLSLSLNGVQIGDCLYDWHLRKRDLHTVDVNTQDFKDDVLIFVKTFCFWYNYLKCNNVLNIVLSHSVYIQGILVRLGLSADINVYVLRYDGVFKLNKDLIHSDLQHKFYNPSQLKKTTQLGYEFDFVKAERSLKLYFQNSSNTSFVRPGFVFGNQGDQTSKVIFPSTKPKVLIACHCFSDAPHQLGVWLFRDYWDWTIFLCEESKNQKYEWYIKPHPAFSAAEKTIFQSIIYEFPNLKVIEATTSNLAIYEQGIDVILTAYGSIGFEAAAHGVTVVTASNNPPYENYDFFIKPQNRENYELIIKNLNFFIERHSVDPRQIVHYFDQHYAHRKTFWYLEDNSVTIEHYFENYLDLIYNSKVLTIWIDNFFNKTEDAKLYLKVEQFINSSEYLFTEKTNNE